MTMNTIIGFLVAFVPLFAVGYLMLNKNKPVFRMFLALLVIGLGYLGATGALEDIGTRLMGATEEAAAPADATPAPEAAPAATEAPAVPEPAAPEAAAPAPAAPEAAPADAAPADAAPAADPAPAE